MNTDFFAAFAAVDKRVTQISQMTQIFLTYSVRLRRFFLYILYADETYSVRLRRFFDSPALFPCRGQKSKGLAESAYATELRLFYAIKLRLFGRLAEDFMAIALKYLK